MQIQEIYEKLKNNQSFEFKEQSIIKFNCPHCGKELIKHSLYKNHTSQDTNQEYLYDDGDTIDMPEKYWMENDCSMMIGECDTCGNKIGLINIDAINEPINKDIKTDFFMITNKNDLIKKFDTAKQYAVILNNQTIGIAIIYRNAILNKKSVSNKEISNDITRNITMLSLECLDVKTEMNVPGIGVCNGHYETKEQISIWQQASYISEELIKLLK